MSKKISILGAVRSGIAAAKLASKYEAIPFVSDCSDNELLRKNVLTLENLNIEYELGNHSERVFEADLIITSPGIPSDAKVLIEAKRREISVISELEFASYFCKGIVVGITGTNGKTTTTTLLNYLLNNSGKNCYSAGNIGTAFSEITDNVSESEFVALEVSSFQLDYVEKFSPKFSVILNFTPDHLNRYENNFEKYAESKMKIFMNQTDSQYFIGNNDDEYLISNLKNINAQKFLFSIKTEVEQGTFIKEEWIVYKQNGIEEKICKSKKLSLPGEHNLSNCLAVITVAKLIGISNKDIENALSTFTGVEHRLELTADINNVKYINDSKATNVDAVWYALRSFDNPIFLILGGKDKGNDYNQILAEVKARVKKIYAIGVSAQKVYDFFKDKVEVEMKSSLGDAVKSGNIEATNGDIILLSPACASFDMFDDYEHRGNVFKQRVKELIN